MANFDRELVIETTRWGANLFSHFSEQYPDKREKEIFKMMISQRYKMIPDEEAENFLLAAANEMNGLRALVAIVLDVETGILEQNSSQTNKKILDIIDEELEEYNLSGTTEKKASVTPKSKYLVGIAWILISLVIAFIGINLSNNSGLIGVLGWVLNIGGIGFAILAIKHLFQIYKLRKN